MSEKIAQLAPEIILAIAAVFTMIIGLFPNQKFRNAAPWIACFALALAALFAWQDTNAPQFAAYTKIMIASIGILLLWVIQGVPESLHAARLTNAQKIKFDPANVVSGEFYAFFLISLAGAMLCASATDLAWLFLALELTSLPTYVMIAISKDNDQAQESSVKYFFLGALSAAFFLYGFTLIYGATGQTEFAAIRNATQTQILAGNLSPLMIAGLVLSVIGIGFKIACVPMHYYTADVYQGAATGVSAFLAFVPKTAGFVSLIWILSLVGNTPQTSIWNTDSPAHVVITMLAILAAFTMTVGNLMGVVQKTNVKRVLAYSSIAHSGYLMLGLVAGPYITGTDTMGNGLAAILFYLIAYGLANLAVFAVIGSITKNGEEAQTYKDIAGLKSKNTPLFIVLIVGILSLMGLPPVLGFNGKAFLFGSATDHGYTWLVVIGVINSAISAVYYIRIASTSYFDAPDESAIINPPKMRPIAAYVATGFSLLFFLNSSAIIDQTAKATANINAPQAPIKANVTTTTPQTKTTNLKQEIKDKTSLK